ncbi:MAG TPA: SDR family oxidoreductase [Isosphaeraceae bacterium]|jgi:NAD(P)-dependent dehydrogenase (short-subunit alcohol dehydrogenase family)|nr:SDR family oxidoreductase [Isosphaeraceae bacterium]
MAEPDQTMAGKVCLVTGATSGIGQVTARELARLGASVVVVGRSLQKCEATVSQIRQQTGHPRVDFLVADLSSQAEVRRLASEFLRKNTRLDVLVNNAGGMFMNQQESVDGIELTLALNHLAYFLLTNLLLERLKASAPARIVNVSSEAHRGVTLDFDNLQAQGRYGGFRVYSQSKLANLLFTFELARRLEGTGVTVNALHPGFVATNIFAGNGLLGWSVRRIASLIAMSPEQGAKTSIYLAASPEVEGVTGQYFAKQKRVAPSPASLDEAAARRLWEVSEQLTGLGKTERV